MAFGYVVVDKDNNVKRVINEDEAMQYKIVDNVESYSAGDRYPKLTDEEQDRELKDYSIAEGRFINGFNTEKTYVWRIYPSDQMDFEGGYTYALADTIYGPQAIKILRIFDRGDWAGVKPTKDIISTLPNYEEYDVRQKCRINVKTKAIKEGLERRSKEEKKERKNNDVYSFRIDIDDKNLKEFNKLLEDIFNDYTAAFFR